MNARTRELGKSALAILVVVAVCAYNAMPPAAAAPKVLPPATPAPGVPVEVLANNLEDIAGVWQFSWPEVSFLLEYTADGRYTLLAVDDVSATNPVQEGRIWWEGSTLKVLQTRVYVNGQGPEPCAGSYKVYRLQLNGSTVAIRQFRLAGCSAGPQDTADGQALPAMHPTPDVLGRYMALRGR